MGKVGITNRSSLMSTCSLVSPACPLLALSLNGAETWEDDEEVKKLARAEANVLLNQAFD